MGKHMVNYVWELVTKDTEFVEGQIVRVGGSTYKVKPSTRGASGVAWLIDSTKDGAREVLTSNVLAFFGAEIATPIGKEVEEMKDAYKISRDMALDMFCLLRAISVCNLEALLDRVSVNIRENMDSDDADIFEEFMAELAPDVEDDA